MVVSMIRFRLQVWPIRSAEMAGSSRQTERRLVIAAASCWCRSGYVVANFAEVNSCRVSGTGIHFLSGVTRTCTVDILIHSMEASG